MKADEKELFTFVKIDAPEIRLPPQNQNRKFGKMDIDSLSHVSDEFKILAAIYKLNMTKQPAHLRKLEEMLQDVMSGSGVLRYLNFLDNFGLIEAQYGETEPGRAGRIYYIDSDSVQEARKIYETHVRPYEKTEDQIDFVPGLLIEK